LVSHFHFTEPQIEYLRKELAYAEPEFFEWLSKVDCSEIKLYAPREGTVRTTISALTPSTLSIF